jgi:hypothetical protein
MTKSVVSRACLYFLILMGLFGVGLLVWLKISGHKPAESWQQVAVVYAMFGLLFAGSVALAAWQQKGK